MRSWRKVTTEKEINWRRRVLRKSCNDSRKVFYWRRKEKALKGKTEIGWRMNKAPSQAGDDWELVGWCSR